MPAASANPSTPQQSSQSAYQPPSRRTRTDQS